MICPKLKLYMLVASLTVGTAGNANAETTAKTDAPGNSNEWVEHEERPKPKIKQVQIGKYGKAQVRIQDLGGEPVSSGIEVTVELTCGQKKFRPAEPTLRICEFKDVRFDNRSSRLILTFKVTETVQGRQECNKDDSFDFPLSTLCRK